MIILVHILSVCRRKLVHIRLLLYGMLYSLHPHFFGPLIQLVCTPLESLVLTPVNRQLLFAPSSLDPLKQSLTPATCSALRGPPKSAHPMLPFCRRIASVFLVFVLETGAWTVPGGIGTSVTSFGGRRSVTPSFTQRAWAPLLELRSAQNSRFRRDGAMRLAMANQKKKKGPRKRSQRLSNTDGFRNSGPVGAAKRKILQRQDEEKALKFEEWDSLKDRLIAERERGIDYPVGWTGDAEELRKKKAEWNADMFAPSTDEQADENNIEPTNDPKWMQVTDPASGDVYFWNIDNDKTVWDVPDGVNPTTELSEFRGITRTIPDPAGEEASKWLCTQTTSGHAHHGIFFQLEAKEADVYVTGIRTAAHYRSDIFEGRYRVLVRDGEVYGTEYSKKGWKQIGLKVVKAEMKNIGPKSWDAIGLPRAIKTSAGVMFDMLPGISAVDTDPEVIYGSLPLSEAIHIRKGEKKAVCIWNDDMLGIVFRKKDNFVNNGRFKANRFVGGFFDKGEVTDENADLRVLSGLVPRKDVFRGVLNAEGYCAFVGVLQYVMKEADVPEMPEMVEEAEDFLADTEGPAEEEGEFVVGAVTEKQTTVGLEEEQVAQVAAMRGDGDGPEDEQEEVPEEELMEGPEQNFFGGGGPEGEGGGSGEGGEVTLLCFSGEKELGELGVDAGTTWEELRGALADMAGGAAVMSFRHPDGVGEVKVASEGEWGAALELLLDEQWDLDGFLDVDITLEA